jgi:hypothetical protein
LTIAPALRKNSKAKHKSGMQESKNRQTLLLPAFLLS